MSTIDLTHFSFVVITIFVIGVFLNIFLCFRQDFWPVARKDISYILYMSYIVFMIALVVMNLDLYLHTVKSEVALIQKRILVQTGPVVFYILFLYTIAIKGNENVGRIEKWFKIYLIVFLSLVLIYVSSFSIILQSTRDNIEYLKPFFKYYHVLAPIIGSGGILFCISQLRRKYLFLIFLGAFALATGAIISVSKNHFINLSDLTSLKGKNETLQPYLQIGAALDVVLVSIALFIRSQKARDFIKESEQKLSLVKSEIGSAPGNLNHILFENIEDKPVLTVDNLIKIEQDVVGIRVFYSPRIPVIDEEGYIDYDQTEILECNLKKFPYLKEVFKVLKVSHEKDFFLARGCAGGKSGFIVSRRFIRKVYTEKSPIRGRRDLMNVCTRIEGDEPITVAMNSIPQFKKWLDMLFISLHDAA